MTKYTYFVRDFFKNEGFFPLSGEHFKCLLEYCFCHSAYLSFSIKDCSMPIAVKLEEYIVPNVENPSLKRYNNGNRRLYQTDVKLQKIILDSVNDLFEFYTLGDHKYPEDPVFIRKDGSILFESIIHEGECSLFPLAEEDIRDILAHGNWLYMNENGYPEVPAAEHQFPYPTLDEVLNDELFQNLQAIRKTPSDYLTTLSIEEIERFIECYRPAFLRDESHNYMPSFSCVPQWYFAFKMYVLGECSAMTFTKVSDALLQKGYSGVQSFRKFYELLDRYLLAIRMNTIPEATI